jgi:hypothetical protein
MERPICSVVIPTHNCLSLLGAALASVEGQTGCNIEIIVINDGSTDGTGDWLETIASEKPWLRVFHTGGIGPGEARNEGIAAARAPLIAFLDADDWWWPGKLERQIAYHAAHPEAVLSFTDYLHVTHGGESRGSCFEYWNPRFPRGIGTDYFALNDALSVILETNLIGTSTVIARKPALENAGGFGREASAEDWRLWLALAANGPVACSRSITATYLMRPGSVTSMREERIAAMNSIIGEYEKSKLESVRHAAAKAKARLHAARAELARSNGRHLSAARYHSRAFVTAPSLRLGRETTASLLNAALQLAGHGVTK